MKREAFGVLLGKGPQGVEVFSSNYSSLEKNDQRDRDDFKHYVDEILMGYKWQCVELARRWYYLTTGYIFEDIPMAYDIFQLDELVNPKDKTKLPLSSFKNGSKHHPSPGSMLIWNEGGEFEITGHVAIITEVFKDKIRIIEQNVEDTLWPSGQTYSRELSAFIDDREGYWIKCQYPGSEILGWVVQTDDKKYAYKKTKLKNELFSVKLAQISKGKKQAGPWLNLANDDEKAYVEMMGGHKITSNVEDEYKYFCISKTAEKELVRASSELHMMFLHATDYVIHSPKLLEKFCFPKAIIPRLIKSWLDRKNEMLTGRFDFSMKSDGLKLYEYNADSASCYMETAIIQKKWAEHYHCEIGTNPGEFLQRDLALSWKDISEEQTIHLLHDHDPEEKYHTLFFKEVFESAGFKCKDMEGIDDFHWGEDNSIVDGEGETVKRIWKTWAWETVLDRIREECEEESCFDEQISQRRNSLEKPRLLDILLNPAILVNEPFWTLIPSNKAILPVLTQLYPKHPYLLKSSFRKSDFKNKATVTKPISGRCGENIIIENESGESITSTKGKFSKREQIYQDYFPLPKLDDLYVQISTFTVNGKYSAMGTRYDRKKILTRDSDLLAIRVLDDVLFENLDRIIK